MARAGLATTRKDALQPAEKEKLIAAFDMDCNDYAAMWKELKRSGDNGVLAKFQWIRRNRPSK